MDKKDKKVKPENWEDKNKPTGPIGWVCPVCGKGLAPWARECGCVQPQYVMVPTLWSGGPPGYCNG